MAPKIGTSPAYLIWNLYSYCFRIKIPKDIQRFFGGKRELRSSLKTAYLSDAKQKARYLAGNVQRLFDILRISGGWMDNLTNEQIQLMINRYIRNKLESVERIRVTEWRDPDEIRFEDEQLKGLIESNQSELAEGCIEMQGDMLRRSLSKKA